MKVVDFLQPLPEPVRSRIGNQTAIGQMQEMKKRESEFVRWRSVKVPANDVELLTQLEDMRTLVYAKAAPLDLDMILPGSASAMSIDALIAETHQCSLAVTNLKVKENKNMCAEYKKCWRNCHIAP